MYFITAIKTVATQYITKYCSAKRWGLFSNNDTEMFIDLQTNV